MMPDEDESVYTIQGAMDMAWRCWIQPAFMGRNICSSGLGKLRSLGEQIVPIPETK